MVAGANRARADPGQPLAAQRGRHRLARHPLPQRTQIGQDPRRAVHAVGGLMEYGDLGVQLGTPLLRGDSARRRGLAPFVEPRPGYLQQLAHPLDTV